MLSEIFLGAESPRLSRGMHLYLQQWLFSNITVNAPPSRLVLSSLRKYVLLWLCTQDTWDNISVILLSRKTLSYDRKGWVSYIFEKITLSTLMSRCSKLECNREVTLTWTTKRQHFSPSFKIAVHFILDRAQQDSKQSADGVAHLLQAQGL